MKAPMGHSDLLRCAIGRRTASIARSGGSPYGSAAQARLIC
jgi:hypothetical protein